jgi:hypothetical protein
VCREQKCADRHLGLEVSVFSHVILLSIKVNFVDGKAIYLGYFTFISFFQNVVLCVGFFV